MTCVAKLLSAPLVLSLVASQGNNEFRVDSKTRFPSRELRGGTEVSAYFEKLGKIRENVRIISILQYLRHGSRVEHGSREEQYGNKTLMDHLCQVADGFDIECRIPQTGNKTLPEKDGDFDDFPNMDLTNHGWNEHVGHGKNIAFLVENYMNKNKTKLQFDTSPKPRCIVSQKAFQCGLCAQNAAQCELGFQEDDKKKNNLLLNESYHGVILLNEVYHESASNVSTKDYFKQIGRDYDNVDPKDKCFMGDASFEGEIDYKDMCKGQTVVCENSRQTLFYKKTLMYQMHGELKADLLSDYEKVKNSTKMTETLQKIANLTGKEHVTFDEAMALYELFTTEGNLLPENKFANGKLLWKIFGENKQIRLTFNYLNDLKNYARLTNPAAAYGSKDVVGNLLNRLEVAAESDDDDHDKNLIYVFHSHRIAVDHLQSVLIPLPELNTKISAETARDNKTYSTSFRTPMAANVAVILYEMDNKKYVVVAQNGRVFQDEDKPVELKAFEDLIEERLQKFACDTKEFIKNNADKLSEKIREAAKTIKCDKDGGDDSEDSDNNAKDNAKILI